MQPPPRSGRGTRLSLLGLGLLALLSIVAFASRSGIGHRSQTAPSQGYVNYALTVFLILFVLMIPVAVYAFLLRIRERATATPKSFKARVYTSLRWLALVIAVAIAVYYRSHHLQLLQHVNPFHEAGLRAPHAGDHPRSQTNPQFQWNVLWIAIVVLTVTAAYTYYRWKKSSVMTALRELDPSVSEDLAATIGDAIDDLEAEPDARRAVIAAYARMEAVLGRNGFQRAPSETAIEYLRRVLLGLTSRGDAVTRLTSLFEQAKFSQNEIDSAMKQDAIDALREIREGLA